MILTKGLDYEGYKGVITDAWYLADGADFNKITDFIENVVVGEKDYLKPKREQIFKDNFDVNCGNASRFIFNYIKKQLI